jgi:hypothetical protein
LPGFSICFKIALRLIHVNLIILQHKRLRKSVILKTWQVEVSGGEHG